MLGGGLSSKVTRQAIVIKNANEENNALTFIM